MIGLCVDYLSWVLKLNEARQIRNEEKKDDFGQRASVMRQRVAIVTIRKPSLKVMNTISDEDT